MRHGFLEIQRSVILMHRSLVRMPFVLEGTDELSVNQCRCARSIRPKIVM